MDWVHVSWKWVAALAVSVGCIGALAAELDDGDGAVAISAVTAESDSDVVEVVVQHHHGCGVPRPGVSVAEDDAVVSLRAVYDESGGCAEPVVPGTVVIVLARPLGDRVIEVRSVARGAALSCEIDGKVSDRCFRG